MSHDETRPAPHGAPLDTEERRAHARRSTNATVKVSLDTRELTGRADNLSRGGILFFSEGDLRVPISQGYELYNALKQQGVPVRMLVMPRQAHGPTEPKMLLKVMQTNVEWFDKYLGNES